jgi:hypothetical protein
LSRKYKEEIKMSKKFNTSERIKQHTPIEVWESFDGSWTWEIYRKYQKPENEAKNPYARWFCKVLTPIVPEGEFGDVYVRDIQKYASKISKDSLEE